MRIVREIDTMHLGRDRVIAAHEVRGELIVDPGPASALDTLLEGLSGEPRAVLLTHIHLDHASATGALVRRWPELRVYVSAVAFPSRREARRFVSHLRREHRRYDAVFSVALTASALLPAIAEAKATWT